MVKLATVLPRRSDAGIVPMPARTGSSGSVRLVVKHGSFGVRAMALLGRTLRHIVQRRSAGASHTCRMQVVETLSLGERKQILLLECDGARFLVTSSAHGLSAPAPVDASALMPQGTSVVAGSWR